MIRQHGLAVFWIAGKKDLATRDIVCVAWLLATIEESLDQGPGQWFVAIDETGLRSTAV